MYSEGAELKISEWIKINKLIARTPVEVDLGIPLKHPGSQTEYSAAIRRHLNSVQKVAQEHLAKCKSKQKTLGNSSTT